MKILLDSNNLALYIGQQVTVKDDCVVLSDGSANYSYNASNTTEIDAVGPTPPVNFAWQWSNGEWVCVNQEAIDAYNAQQKDAFNAVQKKKRFLAYTTESDPIFFKAQRGEATNQEWLDAIAAIDARFPYQE